MYAMALYAFVGFDNILSRGCFLMEPAGETPDLSGRWSIDFDNYHILCVLECLNNTIGRNWFSKLYSYAY